MQHATATKKTIRVLIVDDSAVVRASIGRILLESSPEVAIVGYAEDGTAALKALDVCDPNVIILDLTMPKMDGITALPLILQKRPHVRVVVCSARTSPGAEISVRALSLGATDCVPKPAGSKNAQAIAEFEASLKQAVLSLYEPAPAAPVHALAKPEELASFRPKVVAIGSSTGGPNALITLLKELGPLPVPVIVTQHLNEKFTAILARQLEHETGIPCIEGAEGMMLDAGRVYIAPGGSHMQFKRSGMGVTIKLDDGPPENFCKPSVDVMLRGALTAYGGDVMAVILTGMGKDGLKGCERVYSAGGRIIVQDQESSIVWGMPGSIANAGIASAIMPLPGLAKAIRACFGKPPLSSGGT